MKGRICITRPSGGDRSGEYIKIEVRDELSRVKFLEVRVDCASFAKALTGLSEMDCDIDVRGLRNVGKKKVSISHSLGQASRSSSR